MQALTPALEWSDEAYLLAKLEYEVRAFKYMMSDHKGAKPEPLPTPLDKQRAQEIEDMNFDLIDRELRRAVTAPSIVDRGEVDFG